MAAYNSTSLPFNMPTTMIAGRVYALIAQAGDIVSAGPITFSPTYGGSYNALAAPTYVNGGFLKSAVNTVVTITRQSLKQISSGPKSYKQAIMNDRPSYYWSLDETTGLVASDIVGGANGTISGGVTLNQSGIGKSMLFNGLSGVITAPATPLPLVCTVEMWMKVANGIIAIKSALSNRFGLGSIMLGIENGKLAMYSAESGAGSVARIDNGQWHHVVYILTGSTTTFYIDGLLDTVINTPRSAAPINIIRISSEEGGIFWWDGNIDEVAIYPYALSAKQILAHYNARNIT
jgi:hypothetical protein